MQKRQLDQGMSVPGVRRDKAALSSGCKPHPAKRSSRMLHDADRRGRTQAINLGKGYGRSGP
jgi:hypothetical protein